MNSQSEAQVKHGYWGGSPAGLPCFHYTGMLCTAPEGTEESGPIGVQDPFFLIGNYGLTLFVHASGRYQLMSCERGFARLNHHGGDSAVGASVSARATIDGKPYDLIGSQSALSRSAKRAFGVGWARFTYEFEEGLEIERTLFTVPSEDTCDRVSGFRTEVRLTNRGSAVRSIRFSEGMEVRYHLANWSNPPKGRQRARYPVTCEVEGRVLRASFQPQADRDYVFAERDDQAQADGFPAQVILEAAGEVSLGHEGRQDDGEAVWVEFGKLLEPGQQAVLSWKTGYAFPDNPWVRISGRLDLSLAEADGLWAQRIPVLPAETVDATQELRWHAATLHAMATWDQFHEQTFIPQGTVYEYALGVAACTRDHAQHALPVCHYDPDLARSVLLYLAKHTDARGRLRTSDEGTGYFPVGADQKSDNELYALWLAAEYLKATRDSRTLELEVPFDGMSRAGSGTLLDRLVRWFRFLRDAVHVGPNGLVRLMCSDWNDCFYGFLRDLPYAQIFHTAESTLNTTLAIHVLGELALALESLAGLQPDALAERPELAVERESIRLAKALRSYRADLLEAFIRDWGDAPFPVRARVGEKVAIGQDELFLEPLGFILAIPEIPKERKVGLCQEIEARLMNGEVLGARQRERPGTRESGGIWYALNGNLLVGLATLDSSKARDLARRMSLRHHAAEFPHRWVGQWSGPDSYDSSAVLLPDGSSQSFSWSADYASNRRPGGHNRYLDPFPVFCAHAHAWPLMAHFLTQSRPLENPQPASGQLEQPPGLR